MLEERAQILNSIGTLYVIMGAFGAAQAMLEHAAELHHQNGDAVGEGLARHCEFPVPKWLLSGGKGQSWEWLTEVKLHDSWRYDAVGKPLWSRAEGHTRLEDLGDGRTRIHFLEIYEAFNPVMRVLFERPVHNRLSRDNDSILAALEGGVRWHRRRKAREAEHDA